MPYAIVVCGVKRSVGRLSLLRSSAISLPLDVSSVNCYSEHGDGEREPDSAQRRRRTKANRPDEIALPVRGPLTDWTLERRRKRGVHRLGGRPKREEPISADRMRDIPQVAPRLDQSLDAVPAPVHLYDLRKWSRRFVTCARHHRSATPVRPTG